MNSIHPRKPEHLSAILSVIALVAVSSLGHVAAQSATTLPAKVDGDVSGLSVELTSVQKTEDTITVRFKYINSSDKGIFMRSQIGGQVDDKIYYVDAKNKKKYLVIRDTEHKALASAMQELDLKAGETRGCWAKFPAPPSDVTAISVYIPGAPPFENVSITQ
jgi:hypothetical protein